MAGQPRTALLSQALPAVPRTPHHPHSSLPCLHRGQRSGGLPSRRQRHLRQLRRLPATPHAQQRRHGGGATSPRGTPRPHSLAPGAPLSGSPPKLPVAAASPQGSPAALRSAPPGPAAPYLPARRPAAPPAAGRRLPPPPRRQPLPAPLPPNFWAAPARLHGGSCAAGGRRGGTGWDGQGRANAVPTAGLSRRRARPGTARPPGRAPCTGLGLKGGSGAARRGRPPQAAPGPAAALRGGKGEKQSRTAREFAGRCWTPPHRVPLPADIHKNKRASEGVFVNAAPSYERLKPVKSNSHRCGQSMHLKQLVST